jgi:hypothetical protein
LPGDTEENNETIGKPTKISRKNLRNTGKWETSPVELCFRQGWVRLDMLNARRTKKFRLERFWTCSFITRAPVMKLKYSYGLFVVEHYHDNKMFHCSEVSGGWVAVIVLLLELIIFFVASFRLETEQGSRR